MVVQECERDRRESGGGITDEEDGGVPAARAVSVQAPAARRLPAGVGQLPG